MNFKRIIAWAAIIILGGMYLATLFIAIFAKGNVMQWVILSIFVTVVVGAAGWGLIMINNIIGRNKDNELDRTIKFRLQMEQEKKKMLAKAEEEKSKDDGTAKSNADADKKDSSGDVSKYAKSNVKGNSNVNADSVPEAEDGADFELDNQKLFDETLKAVLESDEGENQ
ncbi:MAG: hypothetical protein K6G11_05715 [Lachnospiraceae bacterium]|nr:hypothetical protein [Lachnospiraceae bacterium]